VIARRGPITWPTSIKASNQKITLTSSWIRITLTNLVIQTILTSIARVIAKRMKPTTENAGLPVTGA
jgi:hypothetical protein